MCLGFTKVSLMNVAALVFGAQIFRIECSSWKILTLIGIKGPSLSLLITLCGKSILFDIRMATPAISWDHLLGKLFSSLLLK